MENKKKEPLDWFKIEELAGKEIVNILAKYGVNIRDGEHILQYAAAELRDQKVMRSDFDYTNQ